MSRQLEELGYTKKTCETCGNDFWSIGERSTCGDAPCDKYEFIGNPATTVKYDLYQIQKEFNDFFKARGHTPITRYPVLAKRWRDDVFLVGASIYDFQPWVTSGLVEPPANPLVIAQPSIRLNDVDNVGRTGRHMTCFTMGAHHAFNKPDDEVYWKDETVKYCHDFIEHIGIDPSEITYIESWWEGGGNAGPCYEICVRGVELATLVFIQYKTTAEGLKEIPLKIVDTGYGLERFAWISQGTPTAYDASFGPVISQIKELAGVELNEAVLAENARIAGMMDIEDIADLKELRRRVADKLGITMEELKNATEPMEAVYVIADHTRCLCFMLADGVIPSNVKEGYLARLILRRTIRFMKDLGLKESLGDIMEIQLEFLSKTYPEIEERKQHILNVVTLEEKRYTKTVSKGKQLVKKTIQDLKKENLEEIPVETLIKLYDSHGMPPETIEEIASEENFNAAVPDNFYTLVAEEHEAEKKDKKQDIEIKFIETELVFYEHSRKTEFEAGLLGFYENNVVLDRTIFYPEGGGQPSDIGYIRVKGNKEKYNVLSVEKIQGVVLHQMEPEDIEKLKPFAGSRITGSIDPERRTSLTQNHTATHLIVAAAREVLGDHVWQAGAQKGVKKSRIDLSHYKRISITELREIEKIANSYVMKNYQVHTSWMNRTKAEKKYGFKLYQGGVVPGANIRTVKIDEIDVQACAGTHVKYTGEIGLIKITRTERIQDGVERLEFSAGKSAIDAVQRNDEILKESSEIFKVPLEQLPKTCERFFKEWKAYKNENTKLKDEIATLKVGSIRDLAVEISDLTVLTQLMDADMNELIGIVTDMTEDVDGVDVVVIGNTEGKIVGGSSAKALERGLKINNIIKDAAAMLGGGGGGRPNLAQGAGKNHEMMEEALNSALKTIEEILKGG
ncbi:alanyl-tRNA synthetase [Methanobacterium lacus]|uniref:Alanine--tRNA ligase n=1 Tax=Methanobacterium lacus (strain AL-21) TaxID=877455 RepID=F0TCS8_METLA|nr:alanine--tRNA ligase [Methanobacterium lacus]ADZ10468.1 alanyl-tRNA synthetase [Methanobacterium lacus]